MRFAPIALLLLSSCTAPASGQVSDKLARAFPALTFASPVDIQAPPDGSGRLFVVEQGGTIRAFDERDAVATASLFLDLTDRVVSGGERGLLGLAFHPRFPDSAYVFVNYTAPSPLRTRISRFTVAGGVAQAASEKVLLEVAQPFSNHNAGQLQFGGDGYLYVGLGDGGSGGDPQGNGQNRATLLGALLRLDVDGGGLPADCGGAAARYTIPAGNPFVGAAGACDEIYAYGLRNPWRFSFGPDGTLFVADVGQGAWEEVDTVAAGGNYGWNRLEGTHCYGAATCSREGTLPPVAEYPHDATTGGFSITGGYVYTGSEAGCEAFRGRYFYGDYVSGNVWTLDVRGDAPRVEQLISRSGLSLSTFGVGGTGRLYLADLNGGALYRLDCEALATGMAPLPAGTPFGLGPALPNPAADGVRLALTGAPGTTAQVRLYDVLGRAVATLFDGLLAGSETPVRLDLSGLAAGTYFVRAEAGAQALTRTVTVAR